MEDKLYDLMDWAEIEAVVYSEEDHPREILGPRVTPEGILIQCFFPGETRVSVKTFLITAFTPWCWRTKPDFSPYC